MPTTSFRRALGLLSLSLLPACASEGRHVAYDEVEPLDSSAGMLTFLEFLEGGRVAVADYLEALPPGEARAIEEVLERASKACTRVGIVSERSGLSYSMVSGSGVLVEAADGTPYVATAGHTFQGPHSGQGAHTGGLSVVLSDGTDLEARLLEMRFDTFGSASDDWALLGVKGSPDPGTALRIGKPEVGELAFVLAYPSQMGVNEEGLVVFGNAYRRDPLAPLVTIGRITKADPLLLDPVAGTVGIDGASGGAIVDRSGQLIGVLSGNGWIPERKGASFWIRGAPVTSFAELLDARP